MIIAIFFFYNLLLNLQPQVLETNPNVWTGASTPDLDDILAHVVSNIQGALLDGTLTISITDEDILRPNKDTYVVSEHITYPCDKGEVLRNGVCGT